MHKIILLVLDKKTLTNIVCLVMVKLRDKYGVVIDVPRLAAYEISDEIENEIKEE